MIDRTQAVIRKEHIHRNNSQYKLYVALVVFLVLNGIGNAFINVFALIALFALLVMIDPGKEYLLHPVLLVFFGYSNLSFPLPFGFDLSISTLANLIYIAILLKQIVLLRRIKLTSQSLGLFALVCTYCAVNTLITSNIFHAFSTIAKLIVAYEIVLLFLNTVSEDIKKYGYYLFIAVVGEIFYGLLFHTNDSIGWRSAQFCGVKDPNNMALHCLLLFAIVVIVAHDAFTGRFRKLVTIVSVTVTFMTISFTGICAILFSIIIWGVKYLKNQKLVIALVVFIVAFIGFISMGLNPFLDTIRNTGIPFLVGLSERLELMSNYYSSSNYVRLTSGRSDLWKDYWYWFNNQSAVLRLFGNQSLIEYLINNAFKEASHNFYIDLLISYGIIGSILYMALIISFVMKYIEQRLYERVAVFVLLATLLFSRTVDIGIFMIYTLV